VLEPAAFILTLSVEVSAEKYTVADPTVA